MPSCESAGARWCKLSKHCLWKVLYLALRNPYYQTTFNETWLTLAFLPCMVPLCLKISSSWLELLSPLCLWPLLTLRVGYTTIPALSLVFHTNSCLISILPLVFHTNSCLISILPLVFHTNSCLISVLPLVFHTNISVLIWLQRNSPHCAERYCNDWYYTFRVKVL